jgi:hypothetical protein
MPTVEGWLGHGRWDSGASVHTPCPLQQQLVRPEVKLLSECSGALFFGVSIARMLTLF